MSRLTRNQKVVSEGLSNCEHECSVKWDDLHVLLHTVHSRPDVGGRAAALAKAGVKTASGDDAFA
jgi:hypothetical protein